VYAQDGTGTQDTWLTNATATWDGGSWSAGVPNNTDDAIFGNSAAAETITMSSTEAALGLFISNTSTTSFSGGSLTLGSDGLTVQTGAASPTLTSVTLAASQAWTLAAAVNATTITGGAGIGTLDSPEVLTISGGEVSENSSGGTINNGSGGVLEVLITNGGSYQDTKNGNAYSFSGGLVIQNGSVLANALGQLGAGTITLGASSGGGTAAISDRGTGATSDPVTVLATGVAELENGGSGTTDTYSGTVTLGGNLTLTNTVGNGAGTQQVLSGLITGGSELIVSSDGHSNIVTVSNANNYTGGTLINSASAGLVVSNPAALGAAGATLTLSGGAVDLATDTTVNAYNTTVTANTTIDSDRATAASPGITQTLGTLSIAGDTLAITAGANVSGGTPIVAFGAVTLNSTTTATSTFTPTTAGLTFATVAGSADATKTDTLALDGTAATNAITGAISDGGNGGTVAVTAAGTGAWTLSGANTYSGATTLTSGTVFINNPTALGATASALSLSGATIDNSNGGVTLTNNNPITIAANFTFGGTNNVNLGTGAITDAGNRTITLNGVGSTLTMGGTLTNTANAVQTTTVNGAGNTLVLGAYALSSNATSRVDVINGSGNVTITGSVTNGSTATASGLTYSGGGTLTLAGNATYGGATTVSGGTVVVTGSLTGSSSVSVSNAALAGTGVIANGVTIGNGTGATDSAIIEPGVTLGKVGTLTTGALQLDSDAEYVFNLDSTGGGAGNGASEIIAASLNLANSPGAQFTFNDIAGTPGALTPGTMFTAIQTTNGITGTFANLANDSVFTSGPNTYEAIYSADDLTLEVVSVPEPGTWGMIACGAGMLALLRRRRGPGAL
jgi:autotransporter-associated beta strand protein